LEATLAERFSVENCPGAWGFPPRRIRPHLTVKGAGSSQEQSLIPNIVQQTGGDNIIL